MSSEKRHEDFRKLDSRVSYLYLRAISYKDLEKRRDLLQDLCLAYIQMLTLMRQNSTYYAICTRMDYVEALLIEMGLLKRENLEKKFGTH